MNILYQLKDNDCLCNLFVDLLQIFREIGYFFLSTILKRWHLDK